jgi:hypothetical protein
MQEVAAAMQDEKKILQTQFRDLSDGLNASKAEVETLRSETAALEGQVQTLNQDAQASKAMIDVLNGVNNDKTHLSSTKSETISALSDDKKKLQERVTYLEEVVVWINEQTGKDVESIFEDYAILKKSYDDMASKLKTEGELCSALRLKVKAMETENATLTKGFDELQEETSVLRATQPQTLRSLLTVRLVEAAFDPPLTDGSTEADEYLQNWSPKGLPPDTLNKICSSAEFKDIADLLPRGLPYNRFYGRLRLDVCNVCSRPKLKLKPDARFNNISLKWLNEFVGQSSYFSCCYEKVCRECFLQHTFDTLEYKWWNKLGSLQWFTCPRSGCDEALGIRCEADLQVCLERNCDTEAENHVKM